MQEVIMRAKEKIFTFFFKRQNKNTSELYTILCMHAMFGKKYLKSYGYMMCVDDAAVQCVCVCTCSGHAFEKATRAEVKVFILMELIF